LLKALTVSVAVLVGASACGQHPVITQQPPASLTVTQGGSINLDVAYTSVPVGHVCAMWYIDGFPIDGFTCTNHLTFTNVHPFEAGSFWAVVTHYDGTPFAYSVTSSTSIVRVIAPPILKNLSVSNQVLRFSFETEQFRTVAVPPMTNIVEYRNELSTNQGWTPLLTNASDGNPFHFTVTNFSAVAARRFYRVRVE